MKEFLFLCLLASVAAISEDGGVLILTEANFEDALSAHELSLVEFYAPWCGHCKELAPEYTKAATILLEKESNIKLAKVDATEQPKLAEKFGVKGYPTLKFFRGGKTTDAEYEGNRTAGAIVSWLEKKTTPRTKTLETLEAAREFVESLDVAVIGFFEDYTNAAAKAFKDASIEVDDYEFAITSNDEIRDEYKVEGDSVIVIKKIDGTETVSRISDVTSEADISTFVKFKALPPVMEFNPQTAKKIFSGVVQAHLLLFMSSTAEGHKDRVDMAKEVAKENEGRLLFVTVDTDVEDNKRMLDFFGLEEAELPSFRAIVLSDDMSMANTIKYKPEDGAIEVDNLREFVKEFLAGNLTPHRKSEDLPEDWADKGVKYLVGENFASVAMDEEKDVLVEFYAPWCGHCKELAPVWEELGEKYKEHESVVIAKIDATANELVDVNVQGFPTIKLFKKETNEVVDFDGKRTMEGFVKFLESGGQNEKIIKTKEGDEAPTKEEAKKDEL
jgi:protein disulfide-isomerase A1